MERLNYLFEKELENMDEMEALQETESEDLIFSVINDRSSMNESLDLFGSDPILEDGLTYSESCEVYTSLLEKACEDEFEDDEGYDEEEFYDDEDDIYGDDDEFDD